MLLRRAECGVEQRVRRSGVASPGVRLCEPNLGVCDQQRSIGCLPGGDGVVEGPDRQFEIACPERRHTERMIARTQCSDP